MGHAACEGNTERKEGGKEEGAPSGKGRGSRSRE